MVPLNLDWTLDRILEWDNGALAVLQKFKMDPRYAGHLTLSEACATHGLSPLDLAREIEESRAESRFLSPSTLAGYDLFQWVGYILHTHHSHSRKKLTHLSVLLEETEGLVGGTYPVVREIQEWFKAFKVSLEWHMDEEERNFFPFLLGLPSQPASQEVLDELGSLLDLFKAQEGRLGADLESLERITDGYRPPPDADRAVRDLFHELSLLEEEAHRHIRDEEELLYPKLSGLEKELRARILSPTPFGALPAPAPSEKADRSKQG